MASSEYQQSLYSEEPLPIRDNEPCRRQEPALPSVAIVGLDIGSTAVRAVQATRNGQHAVINHFGLEVLPDGAVVAGVVKDDRAVTAALKNLWSSSSFKTKKVALGVTHQQVVVREIEVANLPAKEFRQALPFLVKDVLPLRADDAILDFHRLEDPGKAETVRGLLIAVPKDAVLLLVRA